MQALIITCLLCLKTPNPCDPSLLQPFTEAPDCSKCMTDLRDYFNLSIDRNSGESVQVLAKSPKDEIPPELKENLEPLLVEAEILVDHMRKSPDEFKDLMNKMKTEINQELIPGSQSQDSRPEESVNAETLKKVQKQEKLLEEINGEFVDLIHQNKALKEKFEVIKGILTLETPKDNQEEEKKTRDALYYGDILLIGEELVSKNGKYKFFMDKVTGESTILDDKGNLVRKSNSCDSPKPLAPTVHMYMNHTLEFYLDFWNGKSANFHCFCAQLGKECSDEKVQCHLKLDDDGHMKFFLPSGEISKVYL